LSIFAEALECPSAEERLAYLERACHGDASLLGRFDEVQDLTLFERLIQVNYLGAVYCTYYALPWLRR
jgi:hypothetical protein